MVLYLITVLGQLWCTVGHSNTALHYTALGGLSIIKAMNDTTAFDEFFFVNGGDILSGVGIAVQQVSSNDMRLEIVRPAW